jgi:hypothetical protein
MLHNIILSGFNPSITRRETGYNDSNESKNLLAEGSI